MDKRVRIPTATAMALSRLRRVAFAAALVSFPLASSAIGVGDPELLSAYSQPLSVRVPVTVTEGEQILQASELSVRLLPYSAYGEMGLSTPPLSPDEIRLDVTGSDQHYWINLRTTQRMREPMMTLLLEVRASGVRIVRELPILFDLPGTPRKPAAAPAVPLMSVAAVTEPLPAPVNDTGISSTPLAAAPPPADDAPLTLITPAPAATPRQHRASTARHSSGSSGSSGSVKKAGAPAPLSTFRLAGWNQSGSAPQALMPRFQLAEHFTSYNDLVKAGTPPAPAAAQAVPAQAPPVAAEPVMPAVQSEPSRGGGLARYWWALLCGLVYAASNWLMGWRQRRIKSMPQPPVESAAAAQAELVEQAIAAELAAPLAIVEPEPESSPAQQVEWQAPAPAVAVAPKTANDLSKRLADLTAKGSNDANMLRKTQLVSAYLDLGRIESAETLLSELEAEYASPSRPKLTLIKG